MYVGGLELSEFIGLHFPAQTYGLARVLAKTPLRRDSNGFYVVKEAGINYGWDCWDAAIRLRQEFSHDGVNADIGKGYTRIFGVHFFNLVETPMDGMVVVDPTPIYQNSNGGHVKEYELLSDEEIAAGLHSRRIDLALPVLLSYQEHNGSMYIASVSILTLAGASSEWQRVSLETNELKGMQPTPVRAIRSNVLISPNYKKGYIINTALTQQPPSHSNGHSTMKSFHKSNSSIFRKLVFELMSM